MIRIDFSHFHRRTTQPHNPKSRLRRAGRQHRQQPKLWIISDSQRLSNIDACLSIIPKSHAPHYGIIFRHYGLDERQKDALQTASICRRRRISMHYALADKNDYPPLVCQCLGIHIPGIALGRDGSHRWSLQRKSRIISAAVHNPFALLRAKNIGCSIAVISPFFPTASKPRAGSFYTLCQLAKSWPGQVVGLGGINPLRARRLYARKINAWGAVAFFADHLSSQPTSS